jgi:hypothetical protein
VSLHEPDARPIRKGRLGKPVEFGYKAQVVDNRDGLIIDHSVHIGNPADNELLRPAIERITTHLGVAPSLVTADRGYWDSTIETDLTATGVTTVVIPRTGRPSPEPPSQTERRPARLTARPLRRPSRGCRGQRAVPRRSSVLAGQLVLGIVDGVLGLVGDVLRRPGRLVDFAFSFKLIVVGELAHRLFHVAFGLVYVT